MGLARFVKSLDPVSQPLAQQTWRTDQVQPEAEDGIIESPSKRRKLSNTGASRVYEEDILKQVRRYASIEEVPLHLEKCMFLISSSAICT